MRVYLIRDIQGFWIGEFSHPLWWDEPPTIMPVAPFDILGIEADVFHAYWDWLWRLGEYTFGALYQPLGGPPAGHYDVERFTTYYASKLWPKYGNYWSAVGATKFGFEVKIPIHIQDRIVPAAVSRVPGQYDIFLRYREGLWWAKSSFVAHEGKWVYEQASYIGGVLMFELRGAAGGRGDPDQWNFGMCWFERILTAGKANWYLWSSASVQYLGFGIRKSATVLGIQPRRE